MAALLTTQAFIWLSAVGLPLLIAPACLLRRLRPRAAALAPWSALPALALALQPLPPVRYDWLLLGTELGLDTTGRIFLLFTAFLWICSGIYARAYLREDPQRYRFFAFFLLTMSGNLGLIMVRDMIGFYFFFTLMSFAAYGLIIHDGSPSARSAGRVYVSLAVLGEVLLITALFLIATAGRGNLRNPAAVIAAAPNSDLITGLLLAGFGIKAGALTLHVWLPLAHPVAPTPASAVLSGAMIKAGLLGWLRFLPLGEAAMPGWGALCMGAGLAAAFYGVLVGLAQDDPKTVLAYSSISQMGIMTLAVGIGLGVPEAWPIALDALLLYALHHALAKAALFLGVGMVTAAAGSFRQRLVSDIALLVPALALAGAPLTSGALAKTAVKSVTYKAPLPWPGPLEWLLALSAVGTALLMTHFLFSLRARRKAAERAAEFNAGLWSGWVMLLVAVSSVAWLLPLAGFAEVTAELPSPLLWASLWPVLAGGLMGWILRYSAGWSGRKLLPSIPPGDVLIVIVWLLNHLVIVRRSYLEPALAKVRQYGHRLKGGQPPDEPPLSTLLTRGEAWLFRWRTAGTLFLLLTAALLVLFIFA